ncbi:thiol-disulfide oxidoreductase DCC family protein [Mycobacterium sp. Marseille-P9652]|uniref:thiol-disulfide oxidoreductase DCC family protein n=1 Tax=Mycobacterium sp. Marseille-P9652 TaxID=2654950 RepID=UPI0012E715BB|nr:DCC1-like thiol-disulfide oxidoreductase family protein [Mycobacterium sp. Marseille-P9652]
MKAQAVPPVLLYDGVCGICNWAVRTVLRFDRDGTLRFAPLDSDFARAIIDRHPEIEGVDSVVFVDGPGGAAERVAVRSEAALRVVDYLGGRWKLLGAARLLPAPLRDRLYDGLAHIRYRVFGRYDSCPLPPPEVRARFVG